MKNKWQDKLRTSLEGYEGPVPSGLWDGISSAMTSKWKSGNRRRAIIWTLCSMAAAAALVLSVLPRRIKEIKRVEYNVIAETITNDKIISSNVAQAPPLIADASPGTGIKISRPHSEVRPERVVKEIQEVYNEGVIKEDEIAQEVVQEPENQQSLNVESLPENEIFSEESSSESYFVSGVPERESLEIDEPKRERSRRRLSFGVSSTNILGSNRSQDGYDGLYGSETAAFAQEMISGVRSQSLSEVLINNIGGDVNTKVKHRQPVRFGVSINYGLTKNLSLETGLNYSFLFSDLRSGTDRSHYDTKQGLHYLGLPLNLNFSILNFGRGRIYISTGGMVEKCVYGTSKTEYIYEEGHRKGEVKKMEVNPLQWSVNAAAGLSYGFSDFLGIYIEPGASYYFDNKNPIETVYSEKPLNFSLRVGLRFYMGK